MDQDKYLAFLEVWQKIAWIGFFVGIGVAVLIFLVHQISYLSAKGLKQKFDIASRYEVNRYIYANYGLALAFFFIVNTLQYETVTLSPVWFFIRVFIGICAGTLHGYITHLIFKYYYPGPLDKKLKRLRYTPRTNPRTGAQLKLLSEEEEDAYLDEGMQAEEDAFSVDYDVWIDTNTGETFIEKYKGYLSALECDRCGFQTLKLQKEEVLSPASAFEDGEILKEYKCSYCGRIRRKKVKLSKRMERDSSKSMIIDNPLKHEKRVTLVKVDIHTMNGKSKTFEFQNLQQAENFLKEFNLDKLEELRERSFEGG
ncbi:MAG: hypothetical protein ACFHWX_18010 [Bacteroidota bacterium]